MAQWIMMILIAAGLALWTVWLLVTLQLSGGGRRSAAPRKMRH